MICLSNITCGDIENIKQSIFRVYEICLIICNRSNKKVSNQSIQSNKKIFHCSICFINHDILSEFNQIVILLSLHIYNFCYIYNRTRRKKNCWYSILYVVIANDLYYTDSEKIPQKFNINCWISANYFAIIIKNYFLAPAKYDNCRIYFASATNSCFYE